MMLPPTLISALQVLSRSGKSPVTADAPLPLSEIKVGQQLQGSVQAQLSPGLFRVLVAGQSIQMRLPATIRSGETINLRVISTTPQLTFSIAASTAPISTQEQIGAAARLLADLAQQPIQDPVTRQLGKTAVWQTALTAPESRQLATALRDALANSGLFYESHQAQWVRGERSTAQLLVEPQNQLLDKRAVLPGTEKTPLSQRADVAQQSTPQNNPANKTSPGDAPPDTPLSSGLGTATVAKELVPLVQQQLHTLETHQLTWAGQVWPGQQMQWEIQGQPEHRDAPQDERQWRTEMELALPRLGDVHAQLVFSGSGLKLTLHVADTATATLFNRSLAQLKSALANVNIPLTAAAVEKS